MATIPALGYFSNATRTEGEIKQALEDLVAGLRQVPGAAQVEGAKTIAGGSITPDGGLGVLTIDTEASASTDDLTNIITTNHPDGAMLLIRNANATRLVVVKHAAGGAGQLNLDRSASYTLNDTKKWLLLVRRGSDWYEVLRGPARPAMPAVAKSGTFTVQIEDAGTLFNCTGTFTVNFISAAIAGNGFVVAIRNVGTGTITLDPNSAELIDAAATQVLSPGYGAMVVCDGTGWISVASVFPTAQVGFTTGDIKISIKDTPDPTWVMMNDTTIGDGASGATGRANDDTLNLFTLIWTKISDQWCPVSGGRGGSAAADFAAHKTIQLPATLGRALCGYGTGVVTASGANADVDTTADTLTVLTNNTKWITGMPVVFTLASGTVTGLTSGNTYYVIRNSATLLKLASSLANAQNGVAIDFTAKSSPVWTITHTYTTRAIGETGGEEAHAESSLENLAHTHGFSGSTRTLGNAGSGSSEGYATSAANSLQGTATTSTGGNTAMNNLGPRVYFPVMMKL